MCFKIGNHIAVIDEDLKGKVVSIEKNQVTFENEYGFLETYPASKLVKITSILENIEPFKLKEEDLQKRKTVKRTSTLKKDFLEIDLHIGHLVDFPKRLSNFEMLTIQVDTARNVLENAIKEKTPKRIVFIHGHGQGVLKNELHQLLGHYAKHCHYFDASFQRYKQGATEVEIF